MLEYLKDHANYYSTLSFLKNFNKTSTTQRFYLKHHGSVKTIEVLLGP